MATDPNEASATTGHTAGTAAEIVRILESETETLTGAIAAGAVSLTDLDRFVQRVERGEIDGSHGTDTVIRIVRSLLDDTAPTWKEMEPAGQPSRV